MNRLNEFNITLKLALEIYLQNKLSSLPEINDFDNIYKHEFNENLIKLSSTIENQIPQ